MALKFLESQLIEFGEKIEIPTEANYYIRKSKTISPRKGREPRINFFYVNPSPSYRMKQIPFGAKYISFNPEMNKFNIEYGQPLFYDSQRNILKIGGE